MNILIGAPSPHIRANVSVRKIMLAVIIALLPACIVGVIVFGAYAALILAVSVVSAMFFEALSEYIMKRPITLNDYSAIVTGLLLGMNLPPTVPIYVPIVGSAVAIIIVKQLFGGLGGNFVNPALAGRAFLMSAFSGAMMGRGVWLIPDAISGVSTATLNNMDGVSSATILTNLKSGVNSLPSLFDAAVGTIGGCIGEVSAIALIIGGLFLIIIKVVDWRIPLFYIGIVAIFTFIDGGKISGISNLTFMMYNLLGGGLMLGAFFMATDYVTSPVTIKGKIIFAIGCGILTCVIRLYGGYPEGVSYSILIMNLAVPLIERFTQGRVFGKRRGKHA